MMVTENSSATEQRAEQVERKRSPALKLSELDLKIADAIVRTGSIKHAALDLNLPVERVQNRGRAIRNQVLKARTFVNQVLNHIQRSAKLKRYWWPKRYEKEQVEEEE